MLPTRSLEIDVLPITDDDHEIIGRVGRGSRLSLKRNAGIVADLRPYSSPVLLSRELMNSPTSIATTTTR